jgi:hypothetical protein
VKLDSPYAVEQAARVFNGASPHVANGNAHRDYLNVSERQETLPKIQSAADLQKRDFPEIRYVVPGIIAPGLTLFAGKPKIGKSWFCLDVALAVAGDRYCLADLKCNVGDVLFIGLEDNERRLRKRIAKLLPTNIEWPRRFNYATEWPRANEGGTKAIREWCRSTPDPRMVVIDVLAAFAVTAGTHRRPMKLTTQLSRSCSRSPPTTLWPSSWSITRARPEPMSISSTLSRAPSG